MKLLIYEYVTAGGMGGGDLQALLGEADAMLHALVRDFSILPDIEVHVLRCPGLPALSIGKGGESPSAPASSRTVHVHASTGTSDFARLLHHCDAALLVAPETGGILHALSSQVESLGVPLLSCRSTAVACAGDKWRTAQALDIAGIAHVPTFLNTHTWPPSEGAWVLKPRDGCGCAGLQRVPDQDTARRQMEARGEDWVAQPWLDGMALSLSVLAGPRGVELLSVNRQRLALGAEGSVELLAVETGALQDGDGCLVHLARGVHAAIPGLHGVFGIDLVLQASGPLVVEVNPRVTSAYPGLGAALGMNPAARWLKSMAPSPAGSRASQGPVRASDGLTLGWDIGGAHLKVAALAADGHLLEVIQRPCALWQGLDRLVPLLDELGTRWGTPQRHAVTMSGEMVDLFRDRQTGVRALLEAFLGHAAPAPVQVYVGGKEIFLAAEACVGAESRIASANWLSSGDWVARHVPRGIVLDVGSTTTDLLCFAHGYAQPEAHGDAARLASDELVYTGVTRTPLMALARRVMFAGRSRGVMAELFASSADIYRVLGSLPDGADQHPSADGGPKTVDASVTRLARMVGCDGPEYPFALWQDLAALFRDEQVGLIAGALTRATQRLEAVCPGHARAPEDAPVVVLAGVGRFLAETLARQAGHNARAFSSIGGLLAAETGDRDALAEQASRCAPAVAVAALAAHGAGDAEPATQLGGV